MIAGSEQKLLARKTFRRGLLLVSDNWITTTFVISYSDGDFLYEE
jgi:hypothetical protein